MLAPPELPSSLIPGLTLDTQSDEALQVHASTPVLPGFPDLNESLRSEVAAELTGYRSRADSRAGEFNVSWNLIGVSERAVGVSLLTVRSSAASESRHVTVHWYDRVGRRLVSPEQLFKPSGWTALLTLLSRDLCVNQQLGSTVAIDRLAADGRLAVAFAPDGGAVLQLDDPEPSHDDTIAVISAAQVSSWLSAAGRHAQDAAVHPRALSSPPPSSGPTSPATAAYPVDPSPSPKPSKVQTPSPPGKERPRVDCRQHQCVTLTFDDGPGPYTARLLEILRVANAPATFFMIGEHVDTFPALTKQVADAGFEIGNHSYTHPDLTRMSSAEITDQLARTDAAILRVTGRRPTLLRPPYGARDAHVDRLAARAGLAEVLWDVDTLDWKYRDAKVVRGAVKRDVRRGSIILLHDIHPTTVQAVPETDRPAPA